LHQAEALIGPDTVETVPPATFANLADPGTVHPTLEQDTDGARAVLNSLPGHGVELSEVLDQLLAEGVDKFAAAFRDLPASLEDALTDRAANDLGWQL
jgi:transaldolase